VKGLDFILQLRPITYRFDAKSFDMKLATDQNNGTKSSTGNQWLVANSNKTMEAAYDAASGIRRSGFIAQEVEQAAKKSGYNFSGIVVPDKDHRYYSLSYESFVVPLVKAVQEQQQIIGYQRQSITEAEKKIAEQDKKMADLQQQLDELKSAVKKLQTVN
jgi:trimeric autotransporter adhesin